ncbi:digestive organ expansion factor [Lentinus tigrinus ALCF2SS1-7]|uniref:U3 small nucleolar RNA-associated protein 25 n=1 Tax=Lentinus tigrinus ALCF2SS1-6 TaxID=1328759 RepID=A0A5C2S237_9APHY|nr:digestive organ expansion factor [Lentinus tigrinus ALCF2SS1-6]RPD78740.1 digestive organ expansion factor [Lentinus tigrinus ALCF2SS1-7]
MAIDDSSSTTTRLLTLLNVSATKAGKRKRTYADIKPVEKLNKRRAVQFVAPEESSGSASEESASPATEKVDGKEGAVNATQPEEDEEEADTATDPYEAHFGLAPNALTERAREAVDERAWTTKRDKQGKLGGVVVSVPDGAESSSASTSKHKISDKMKEPMVTRQAKLPREVVELQNDFLDALASYRDIYVTRTTLETQPSMREALTLHTLNHITKKRRRVLKNNERISHAVKAGNSPPEDVQDQGFTRPSVLILLPFRSSALRWVSALTAHTPSSHYQIENNSRFQSEYGLPPGAIDKLANAEPGTYPRDHVEMFKGNVDDSFRLGVKITKKSVKLFADFYACDLIVASPLGLRMSIEKDKNADFLSSIEVVIVDQMDALTMQNWEHVQFVFNHLNQMPKESHDVDFSRIKPWYLDGHAAYLRQTILLSAYETPETRALFNQSLKNVSGRIRTERRWKPTEVPEGIDQNFVQFDANSPKDEPDKRFQYFTTQMLPAILKSAVQSANTVIFVPSSLDFIRVHNHFRKNVGASFAVLSEYSSNQDISRARQAFFSGKKAFLLISERFHFFRRYKIRGIRNLVFYGPPDHPQFYTEFLSYPFLDEGVDASDVTCRVLYSKYDWLRLERIAGTEGASELIKRGV